MSTLFIVLAVIFVLGLIASGRERANKRQQRNIAAGVQRALNQPASYVEGEVVKVEGRWVTIMDKDGQLHRVLTPERPQ